MRLSAPTAFAAGLLVVSPLAAQQSPAERGDYLVNRVAMCGECHSPRDDHGKPVPGQEFGGAPFNGQPLHPFPGFAHYAPAIRGLPSGYTASDMVKLLETGVRPNGSHPNPPMPRFRFDEEDARAVTAYLAGLKP